jgi:hypothetical protein
VPPPTTTLSQRGAHALQRPLTRTSTVAGSCKAGRSRPPPPAHPMRQSRPPWWAPSSRSSRFISRTVRPLPHQSAASHTGKPLVVGQRPRRLPSALLSVPDESIAFTKRGQHRDRQSFEPAFPVGPSRSTAWVSNADAAPPALPTADPSHLPHRHRPSFSRKQLPRTRAVITDDLDLFHVPPTDFEIRCATHPMHRRK